MRKVTRLSFIVFTFVAVSRRFVDQTLNEIATNVRKMKTATRQGFVINGRQPFQQSGCSAWLYPLGCCCKNAASDNVLIMVAGWFSDIMLFDLVLFFAFVLAALSPCKGIYENIWYPFLLSILFTCSLLTHLPATFVLYKKQKLKKV